MVSQRKREGEDCLKFSIAHTLSHGFNIKERQQIYNATAKIGQPNKAKWAIAKWMDQATNFGFHFVSLFQSSTKVYAV